MSPVLPVLRMTATTSTSTSCTMPPAPKRSALACTRCRQQKMKCSAGRPCCDRCAKAKVLCVYEPPPRYGHQGGDATSGEHTLHNPNLPGLFVVTPPHLMPSSGTSPRRNPDVPRHHPVYSGTRGVEGAIGAGSSHGHQQDRGPGDAPCPPGRTAPYTFIEDTEVLASASAASKPATEPESSGLSGRKRRRESCLADGEELNQELSSEKTEDDKPESPYNTVRAFEATHRKRSSLHAGSSPSTQHYAVGRSLSLTCPLPKTKADVEPLRRCLVEAGLSITDAADMFTLFGQTISPFFPWLYNTDFSVLPSDPVFVLSAVKAISCNLPGARALRANVDAALQRVLPFVLFDDLNRAYDSAIDTLKGIGILYAYSEISVAQNRSDSAADVLSIKGIAEGYAVRWNIARPRASNLDGCLLWLWLYTLSSLYSRLLSCPQTISANRSLRNIAALVKASIHDPQISALLGEVDLCRIADCEDSDAVSDGAKFDQWSKDWSYFENSGNAESRRLRFHLRYAKFWRCASHYRGPSDAGPEVLTAATSFLQSVTGLPPVSQSKLKHMCDFAFLMMVSVCCYLLQTVERSSLASFDTGQRSAAIREVKSVAELLAFLSPGPDALLNSYSQALIAACEVFSGRLPLLTEGQNRQAPHTMNRPGPGSLDNIAFPEPIPGAEIHLETASMTSDENVMAMQSHALDQDFWFTNVQGIPGADLLATFCVPWQD